MFWSRDISKLLAFKYLLIEVWNQNMPDINQAAANMAATLAHPVSVQVINQGAGIWGNVATGLITARAAIAAVILMHQFTLRRERLASEDKLKREQYFIATQLVFLLERFAQQSVLSATETGDYDDGGRIMFEHYLP